MKKYFVFMMAVCLSVLSSVAQSVSEPEFIGEVYLLTSDSTFVKLKKETGGIKAKSGASAFVPMVGAVKSYLTLKGTESETRVAASTEPVQLIIRCEDNDQDPTDLITVMQFEKKKKERRYMMSKVSVLGGASMDGMSGLPYEAQRYGESSYKIVVSGLQTGEYGLMVSAGESATFGIRTFGIE